MEALESVVTASILEETIVQCSETIVQYLINSWQKLRRQSAIASYFEKIIVPFPIFFCIVDVSLSKFLKDKFCVPSTIVKAYCSHLCMSDLCYTYLLQTSPAVILSLKVR